MADKPETQSCANCRYAVERDRPTRSGNTHSCRRYPPQLYEGDRLGMSGLPDTTADAWCGEWSAANPETMDDAGATLARLALAGDLTAARALADKLRE